MLGKKTCRRTGGSAIQFGTNYNQPQALMVEVSAHTLVLGACTRKRDMQIEVIKAEIERLPIRSSLSFSLSSDNEWERAGRSDTDFQAGKLDF
jgi:hypothetical protein